MPKSNLKSGRTWEKIVLALVCLCLIGAIIVYLRNIALHA